MNASPLDRYIFKTTGAMPAKRIDDEEDMFPVTDAPESGKEPDGSENFYYPNDSPNDVPTTANPDRYLERRNRRRVPIGR